MINRPFCRDPVLPEACYLLNTYLGQNTEQSFISSLMKKKLIVEHFRDSDLIRSEEILKKYRDQNVGFVDALIITISERLKIRHILTTDRRHFSVIHPNHCKKFILLP